MSKAKAGNFFEDFTLGQEITHATPRTVTAGDVALYTALYGARFALHTSEPFARGLGYAAAPLDDLLVFHLVFGKTVPDISLNAIANLGYASCVFGAPVYPGDTITTASEVIGLKENSNRKTGMVYVRSKGLNLCGEVLLDYVRWVMVRKRDPQSPAPDPVVPDLSDAVPAEQLVAPDGLTLSAYDTDLAGNPHLWDDYAAGIEHKSYGFVVQRIFRLR
jgi:2-methylfumaryl-CoA hydratase